MAGPDGVSRVVRHNKYYLRGGDLTVHVENHLYRFHSYFFDRESLFFRNKFNLASSANGGEERGSTDDNAYYLEDVKSEDFARFLWVFYNDRYSIYEAPLETWISIITLANRWSFDSVKDLCVRELEKIEIEPVEKISLYHDNTISRLYLIPSYIAVCKRDGPLTFKEGMRLGMETVLRIAEARERLRLQASESGIRTPTFEDFEDAEVEVLIRDIFHLGSRPTSPPSPSKGINGASHNVITLNPAPPGNPPKANGAPAPRANGGSAADRRASSVNSMPSFASVFSPSQASGPPAPPTAPQGTMSQTMAPTAEPRAPVPPAQEPLTVSTSPSQLPPPPPPASAKPKDNKETGTQEASNVTSPKSGGVGEPLSSEVSVLSSSDVSNSKPVVQTSEHSNDLTADSADKVNEPEKDETGRDPDTLSVPSDTEGGKGKPGAKPKKGPKQGGQGRNTRTK